MKEGNQNRQSLKKYDGKRLRFEGRIATFSRKSKYKGSPPTVLVKNIRLHKNQEPIAQHLWFVCGQWSQDLQSGDWIIFDARVQGYERNYKGKKPDRFSYKLVYPSNIQAKTQRYFKKPKKIRGNHGS